MSLTRRDALRWLGGLAGAGAAARIFPGCGGDNMSPSQAGGADGGPPVAQGGGPQPSRPSPIAAENKKAGDPGWVLKDIDDDLQAYPEQVSYAPGETIALCVAHHGAATQASWQLYRLGWYGGAGGRLVAEGGPVDIPRAAAVDFDAATGMVSCPWQVGLTIPLPADAVTGVYVVKLASPIGQQHAVVIVRATDRGAPILYPVGTNTYQAYNPFGGNSLYVNFRDDWGGRQAYAVSYNRPFHAGNGAGALMAQDRPFIAWAEAQGYDIEYAADPDLDADAALARGRRLLVFAAHSEYWTAGMRDNVEAAIAAGTNVAVLAANTCYWQARYAPDSNRRALVSYKQFAAADQPPDPSLLTTLWREVGRPEDAMFGTMFGDIVFPHYYAMRVRGADSWLWAGAQVMDGDSIPRVYGIEVDRVNPDTAPAGIEVLGDGDVVNDSAQPAIAQTAYHKKDSGAEVFAAGSINWCRALATPGETDRRIQVATSNVFARLAGAGTAGELAVPID